MSDPHEFIPLDNVEIACREAYNAGTLYSIPSGTGSIPRARDHSHIALALGYMHNEPILRCFSVLRRDHAQFLIDEGYAGPGDYLYIRHTGTICRNLITTEDGNEESRCSSWVDIPHPTRRTAEWCTSRLNYAVALVQSELDRIHSAGESITPEIEIHAIKPTQVPLCTEAVEHGIPNDRVLHIAQDRKNKRQIYACASALHCRDLSDRLLVGDLVYVQEIDEVLQCIGARMVTSHVYEEGEMRLAGLFRRDATGSDPAMLQEKNTIVDIYRRALVSLKEGDAKKPVSMASFSSKRRLKIRKGNVKL